VTERSGGRRGTPTKQAPGWTVPTSLVKKAVNWSAKGVISTMKYENSRTRVSGGTRRAESARRGWDPPPAHWNPWVTILSAWASWHWPFITGHLTVEVRENNCGRKQN